MKRIVVNGRFLVAAPTGVQRTAEEMVRALDGLLDEDDGLRRRYSFELFAPLGDLRPLALKRIPMRQGGALAGPIWEQIDLPLHARRATVLSLCNFGPVAKSDAVAMIHDAQVHLTPGSYSPAFRLWYRTMQPLFARRHQRILTVSDYSRAQIASARIAPLDAITVIPNGVDHVLRAQPEATILSRLNLNPGTYALGLASTQEHKNIRVLLKAFADPKLGGRQLVLFGGADRAALAAAAGAPLPENVVLAGKVSDAELRALLEAALCLCFPSTTEGFGLPPLEAMQLGCPAICAPSGALPETCGEAALYVDPFRPDAWAEAIATLGEPALRRQWSERGRTHAARFTWASAARKLIAVLDEIGAAPARSPG